MNNTVRPGWVRADRTVRPGWVKGSALLAAVTMGIWATWCSAILLIGGRLPLLELQVVKGDILAFLLMLFIGEPIFITLAYWTTMLILLPITLLTAGRARNRS
ncbi:hypothetical protein OG266_19825 [Streptomyces sp. NBC_00554]|uniref:hypothetical protein n=1 Tax=Streptomyces sp. NBC_00554 TaxID=2903661 RepID=UPI00352E15F8|nr:hypothetical protein OG266_19825 [Streptomyces sp. NBC_00554]